MGKAQDKKGLFRQQVLEQQGERLSGDVLLSQPVTFNVIIVLLLAIVALSVVFLLSGEYNRKEVVRGYLVPDKGLIKLDLPRNGTVSKLLVTEGDQVVKGQALAVITTSQSSINGVDVNQLSLVQIESQIKSLQKQFEQNISLYQQNREELQQTITLLTRELHELEGQKKTLSLRLELSKNQLKDMGQLLGQGHLRKTDWNHQQQQLLVIQHDMQQLSAVITKETATLRSAESQVKKLPLEFEQQQQVLSRQISSLSQKKVQAQAQWKLVIKAPESGKIVAINVSQGEAPGVHSRLLTILPDGARLLAELWLPTRAAGFVAEGQQTRIRYDAFPHQRFGVANGQLAQISRSIHIPGESRLPISLTEPAYRVLVELEEQTLTAYGNQLPLQAGMLLEADIVLDKRNLFDWLLDPLYSLKGRV